MKIYIYLFLFSLFLFPDIMYAQDEKIPETAIDKEKVNLMIFSGMIETYFLYYYDYPDNMTSLIDFEKSYFLAYPDVNSWEQSERDMLLKNDFLFLEQYQNDIVIMKNDSDVVIKLNDWILYKNPKLIGPCDLMELLHLPLEIYIHDYKKMSSPRYFDNAGRTIIKTQVLDSLYKSNLHLLQRKYLKKGKFVVPTYTRNKQTVPIYTFYEYSPTKNGLYYFCRKDDLLTSDFLFYTKLEEFLKEFCLTHGIERMIFPCIEYGKPWF